MFSAGYRLVQRLSASRYGLRILACRGTIIMWVWRVGWAADGGVLVLVHHANAATSALMGVLGSGLFRSAAPPDRACCFARPLKVLVELN